MATNTVMNTRRACDIGRGIRVSMHAMTTEAGPSVALRFCGEWETGLSVEFHGSADDMLEFAARLIGHAEAAKAAERAGVEA